MVGLAELDPPYVVLRGHCDKARGLEAGEVVLDGEVEVVGRETLGLTVDFAEVFDLPQEVARVAEAEGAVGATVVLLDQMFDGGWVHFEAE